jgi:beta-glucosidase
MDKALNRFFIDPFFLGAYPDMVIRKIVRHMPRGFEKDLPGIKGSTHFVGINYYQRAVYRWSLLRAYTHAKEHVDPRAPRSAMWEIYPPGIHRFLLRLRNEYGNPPCYITENGFPLPETNGRDPLDDPERISYLRDHIALVGKAIEDGVDCRGYFHWTLMDNFATQERSWRKSASWYQELVRNNWLSTDRLAFDPASIDAGPHGR